MPARALPRLGQMCWGLSPNSWLENGGRDAEHQLQAGAGESCTHPLLPENASNIA